MSKYEEWYDYEDYDDEYEDEKNIYQICYYADEEEQSSNCEDFEDILFTMKCCNICDKLTVIDRRNGSDVTTEFKKFLKEKGYIFYDEARKEIPELVCQNLPKFDDEVYFHYEEKTFLMIYNLKKILNDEIGILLWKYGYFKFGYVDKLSDGEENFVLFIDRSQQDSPVYIVKDKILDNDVTKEEILSNTRILFNSFSLFKQNIVLISNDEEYYKMIEDSEPQRTPEEMQNEKDLEAGKELAWEEKLRGEKLGYSIDNIEYKGETFKVLKFEYHNKQFVYATESLGIKIAKENDIGSDLEKSIIEFLDDDEFEGMKNKLAEEPYWNRFSEYCNDNYIKNDTVFYGGGDFMFSNHGRDFFKIRLSYDHRIFGYMLAESELSEEELKKIATKNRCNEVLDNERFYKMQKFMDEAHRHADEFSQFCAENDIPNVIEEHTVERVFDFNDFIDDAYDDEWDEEDEYNDEEYDEDADEDDEDADEDDEDAEEDDEE